MVSSHIRIYHTSKRKMRKRYQEMIIRQQGMSLTACRIPFGRCWKYLIAKIYAMVLLYINAWSTTMYFNIPGIFMHQSIPAVPIPPPQGNRGAFAYVVNPGGGTFAVLSWPGNWAFVYPGAIPGI